LCNADGVGPSSPQRSVKDCATGFERERLSNLLMRGIPPIIPSKANQRKPIACNYRCDRDRNSASSVSLLIGPWNYPYQLSLASAVAAMAVGCTVIFKPSELTAHSSALLAKLIEGTFDPSYFAFIEGRVPEATALLEQKFDFIFFTGSVPVGRVVYQAAARHLTSVLLGRKPINDAFEASKCRESTLALLAGDPRKTL